LYLNIRGDVVRKCIAFYHGGRNRPRWLPCPGHAAHHSALCRAHADALSGVVYGLGVLLAPALAKSRGQSSGQSAEPSPGQSFDEFAQQEDSADPLQTRATRTQHSRITRPARNLIQ